MRFGAWALGLAFASAAFQAEAATGRDLQDIPVPPPVVWELGQNEPNPFCNATRMQWAAPVAAHVRLDILSPDGATLLRTLHDQDVLAGFWTLVWDGRDATDIPLAAGTYPYRLRATNAAGALLFERTRTATVSCAEVGVEPRTWSGVRQLYR